MNIDIQRRPGFKHLCNVPLELGLPVKLEVIDGRVICRTESGITMIVPVPRDD